MRRFVFIAVFSTLIGLVGCAQSAPDSRALSEADLAEWRMLGVGEVLIAPEEGVDLRLEEGADSLGVMLMAPEATGETYRLSFDVRPSGFEGVIVVLTSAAMVEGGGAPEVPEDYRGDWDYWKSDDSPVRSYAWAMHTGFHQPNAFLRRNPGFETLALEPDPMTAGAGAQTYEPRWHSVVIRKKGDLLKLKIDGKTILETTDTEGLLGGGHVLLRLRGPGDGSFHADYRNIVLRLDS